MKESGMDKLIELRCLIEPLEKYLLELAKKNPIYKNFNVNLSGVSILGVHETILISKKFGFIQRLVEHDKIDFSREGELANELVNLFERKLDNADGVIALLSISSSPIEDLIFYLKK